MITAVVLTKEGGDYLKNCLDGLQEQSVSVSQIIVVHSFPCTKREKITYRYTNGYHGYAHAVNAGVHNLDTDYVFVLNDDTVLHRDCVKHLYRQAGKRCIVQPQIRSLDFPETIDNTGHCIFSDGFNIARGRGDSIDTFFEEQLLVFSGAAFFFHRSALEEIGLLDEDLFSFGEDLDWSLRAIRLGYEIRYVASAIIWHKRGASHSRGGIKKGFWVERNRVCAMIRSWPRELILQSAWHTTHRLSVMGLGTISKEQNTSTENTHKTALGAVLGMIAATPYLKTAYDKRKIDRLRWRISDDDFMAMIQKHLPPKRRIWNPQFF